MFETYCTDGGMKNKYKVLRKCDEKRAYYVPCGFVLISSEDGELPVCWWVKTEAELNEFIEKNKLDVDDSNEELPGMGINLMKKEELCAVCYKIPMFKLEMDKEKVSANIPKEAYVFTNSVRTVIMFSHATAKNTWRQLMKGLGKTDETYFEAKIDLFTLDYNVEEYMRDYSSLFES